MANLTQEDTADISKQRVLNGLQEFGLEKIESGLTKAYLDSVNMQNTSNRFLRRHTEEVSTQEARKISKSILNRESPSLVDILRVFELSVNEEDRQLNGVYYTPEAIVEYIVEETVSGDDTVCDPACGGGAFLLEATKRIHRSTNKSAVEVLQENIYGVDIIEDNIRKSKVILLLYAVSQGEDPEKVEFNISQTDSLRLDWQAEFPMLMSQGFDAVVGNPPYVKIQQQSTETKEHILAEYETVREGNFNTYIPFVELSIRLLDDDGISGLITPLNYFTTLTGEGLRRYLQDNKYVRKVVDFGEILLFEDALTYTAITFLDKKRKSQLEYIRIRDESVLGSLSEQDSISINYSSLNPEKWRLLDEEEYQNISIIESYRRLDEIANIHTGIATLKDDVYTVFADSTHDGYYTTELDGNEYLIEPDICRELVKISTVDDDEELEENKRRIIFPYQKVSTQVSLDMNGHRVEYDIIPPERLSKQYPKTFEYLEDARDVLATREKGGGADYEPWYKYGRKQGIEFTGERLYIPTYSDGPQFMHHSNGEALFCNGYAVFPKREDIEILDKVLNSTVMDYYMKKTSKDIQGDYQCYQKNFIRTFSIPDLDSEEKDFLRTEKEQNQIDEFLIDKYGINIH
ncbi:N-6 DNA Methylase [Halorientalis regularis]|uniref:site-specific DNA-methyltransferase (adenine-specific) n=2 Tax=Halorientalis regularis TaxID=660518 RepID=A0A1G7RLN7_9EURY|nr:N-6 DNA Methylase [Halorientalis regularis]